MTNIELERLKLESITNGLKDRVSSLAHKASYLYKTIALNPTSSKYVAETISLLEDIKFIQNELL